MKFPGEIEAKLPHVGTTIFTIMSKLATEHNAINLSQGFPDFDCSEELIRLVNQYMLKGFNQYAPLAGVIPLLEGISEKMEKLYGASYDPVKEITVTAGATQAIYTAITSVIMKEDEVIIFDPAYDCYAPTVELCGGVPVNISLSYPDYKIDWDIVKARINDKTRMIVINTPSNPAGVVIGEEDMRKLEEILNNTKIILLSDEVYEHIIFDGKQHQSVAKYTKLAERAFVIYSFGKTFHATGWKIGYCLAPENLMKEFRAVHQFNVFTVNTAIQYALADYIKNEDNYNFLPSFYQKKRDMFTQVISASRFSFVASEGTYFQLVDYSKISEEKDTDFAKWLTTEKGVGSIPVSVFHASGQDDKVVRFSFCKKVETIEQAGELICRI
ncbi:MAG: methionine aminotransferase [Bacteroidetes bacterium]|nr:methionine aminotransferase [Bacteroidota bacterium]